MGNVIGLGNSNHVENANEVFVDVTVRGLSGTFQKHEILIEMEILNAQQLQNNIITWELKNITDNIVIDSGTWVYGSDLDLGKEGIQPRTSFWKNIIYTTNCVGDVLRLRMWLPIGRTGEKLNVVLIPNTFYS